MFRIPVIVLLGVYASFTLAAPAPLGFLGDWYTNSFPGYTTNSLGYGYLYTKPASSFNYDSGYSYGGSGGYPYGGSGGYPYGSSGGHSYGSSGVYPYGTSGGIGTTYSQYPPYRGSGFRTTRPYFGTGYETRSYVNPLGQGDYGPYNTPSYTTGGVGTEYGAPYPGGTYRGGGYRGTPYSYGRSGVGGGSGVYGGGPYLGPTYSSKYNQ